MTLEISAEWKRHTEWPGQFFEYIVVELRLTLVMKMMQRCVYVVKQIYVLIMLLVTVGYLIG
jgi:hypothetical protein